jgi:hypothetical protein
MDLTWMGYEFQNPFFGLGWFQDGYIGFLVVGAAYSINEYLLVIDLAGKDMALDFILVLYRHNGPMVGLLVEDINFLVDLICLRVDYTSYAKYLRIVITQKRAYHFRRKTVDLDPFVILDMKDLAEIGNRNFVWIVFLMYPSDHQDSTIDLYSRGKSQFESHGSQFGQVIVLLVKVEHVFQKCELVLVIVNGPAQ